ncbi:uncharacterized protein L969DRAFT_47958 [Mixia osmundae IAM 14324]|uniref:Ubiquinol-cytochrome c chaperone domain-containing protein n=1 Tax=Mixia osmundae (strain CBS 9802 / IAM 14324 / JCM 22182 / KY 12970) TaxID=764103 RepID=G7E9K5_MIXOS|nr:uncharacterized protein L969DRAFT_47958 [Mixia osmundae IAM 14324]KEI39955.1 hypothetical protein L969DRAFT_47958 [Mixia osmundae IAM 14324]GAA99324.1 hypothetical protein E5Q_06019 [Mixia osmundae IAM 14324]
MIASRSLRATTVGLEHRLTCKPISGTYLTSLASRRSQSSAALDGSNRSSPYDNASQFAPIHKMTEEEKDLLRSKPNIFKALIGRGDPQVARAMASTFKFYKNCEPRYQIERDFFYNQCGMPDSFQTWFGITNLYGWILTVRLRALPAPLGQKFNQQMVNRIFFDAEDKIKGDYKIKGSSVIKGSMKDLLAQYHGFQTALDEGLVGDDATLAAAIWRNMFGAGWANVAGVKGKARQRTVLTATSGVTPDRMEPPAPAPPSTEPEANMASAQSSQPSTSATEADFAEALERLVLYVRKEVKRTEHVPDSLVLFPKEEDEGGVSQFGRIMSASS